MSDVDPRLTDSDDPAGVPARIRWQALFQLSHQPLFVLGANRRIRFVNSAWEQLTGRKLSEIWGTACARSGRIEPLFRSLIPTPDALAGKLSTVRRPAPPGKFGPPWWDITFLPLLTPTGVRGFVCVIDVVASEKAKSAPVPAAIGSIREKHAEAFRFELFMGSGPDSEKRMTQLRLASQTTVPIWISGEPGTGKETMARVIHHHSSAREKAFLGIDCLGLQPYLIESLLFGRGTAVKPDSNPIGTIYLKNPAALPRDLQSHLLDWILSVDTPRIICGALTTAAEAVKRQALRPEFQSALSVLELTIPPLRNRLDELPRLIECLSDRIEPRPTFLPSLVPSLCVYRWPGNIRELLDVLLQSAANAQGEPVSRNHLPRSIQEAGLFTDAVKSRTVMPPLDDVLLAVEKRLIKLALKRKQGNQTEAAALLGIFRARLGRRIEALNLGGEQP